MQNLALSNWANSPETYFLLDAIIILEERRFSHFRL